MSSWQYGQLTITLDDRVPEEERTALWHGPGQGIGENLSESNPTVPELLNRLGADGWELVALQEHGEGRHASGYWDAAWSQTIYTFKRRV